MYDLHRLRLLREVSHRGTLAAVATALGYSPSAVSHQLGLLEREVGVELLEPAGRSVRLTAAAQVLVRHTEAILRELESAEAAVAATRTGVGGVVRVACFQTAAHALLPDVIDELDARHPELVVSVTHVSAELAIPALVARDFDLVLSERHPGDRPTAREGVSTTKLLDDELLLAVPQDWPVARLADLADRPWVAEPPGTSPRAWLDSTCRTAGFEPRVRFASSDVYLHARLVAAGRAAAVIPRLALADAAGRRTLPTGASRSVTMSTRAGGEAKPSVAAVGATLRRRVEAVSPSSR